MANFMNKIFAVVSIVLGLSFVLIAPVYAQKKLPTPTPTSTPTPTPAPQNSFELFWPLVTGKTESDSVYSLKLIKEQVRGWFIFDNSKKADYAVLLGTKRVLEAEKLIKDGKTDLALKALERATSQFSSAYNHIEKANSKGKFVAKVIRRDRLLNVKILIDRLKTTSPVDIQPALDTVKEKAQAPLRSYLP